MSPICFLTGASGFVGRHLAPLLLRTHRLRVLVRDDRALPWLADHDHERVEGRLGDDDALRRGVAGADVVVHLAALVSFRPQDRGAMFATNADATARLAAAACDAGVRRFLHCSTISAIAYRDRPEVVDETAPFNFGRLRIGYCDSKFAAERRVLDEVQRGLDAVIVNPPSMYGRGDRRKGDGSLITALLDGRIGMAPPGGINVADVANVCEGIVAAIQRGRTGERYVLGGENLTGRQLLERVAAIAHARAPRRVLAPAIVRAAAGALAAKERWFGCRGPLTSEILRLAPRFLWFSSAKAERELGYRPQPVDAGIAAACDELRERH